MKAAALSADELIGRPFGRSDSLLTAVMLCHANPNPKPKTFTG
jgi:hypothetical protein